MIGFPQVPFIKHQFAYQDGSRSAAIPASTADFGAVSYSLGIPIAYTIPKEGGGRPFMRKVMNRMVYDSTVGKFRSQFGFYETFNSQVCSKINGYPKGAVLKWYKFTRVDGGELPAESADELMGELEELSDIEEILKTYKIGHVGQITESGKTSTVVVIHEYQSEKYNTRSLMTVEITLEYVYDVMSAIGDNKNDFRVSGPTSENGWIFVDLTKDGFFPDMKEVGLQSSEIFKRSASRKISVTDVEVGVDGWLVVTCVRKPPESEIATLGQFVASYSDGMTVTITNSQATEPVMSVDRQFGGLTSISQMVPVASGSLVSFFVKNDMGVQVDISAHVIGRV